ncbi:MAG: hypothetical protein DRN15_02765 [Thermoprotei archaeon]|nr:MAG: hypothetical protein DRN15_02765 [Thermoprotei archaeon]RLF25358.1 MAG: hypothetical protein DRM97_02085 [Thermoprotei archaeon]
MPGEWKVVLRSREGSVDFNFTEVLDTMNKPLKFSVIDKILDNARAHEHYVVSTSVEKITSPEGEDMTDRQIYVILARAKNGAVLGYLLGEVELESDETLLLILGLWPEEFVEASQRDSDLPLRALASILLNPELWECVDLAVPT